MKVYLIVKTYSDWDENEYEIVKAFKDYLTAYKYAGRISEVWDKCKSFYKYHDKNRKLENAPHLYYHRRNEKFKYDFDVQEIDVV